MSMRLVCALFLFSLIAAAQVDTGTISGLVRDPSGGGIPSAQVTIRDQDTGLANDISTNSTGLYVSPLCASAGIFITAAATARGRSNREILSPF